MFITKVTDEGQVEHIVDLAYHIWHEHFTPIIGQAQVNYMLEKFQSSKSISRQIQNGMVYFLMIEKSKAIGYAEMTLDDEELFLSKIYILATERNKGFGKQTILFLEQLAQGYHKPKISLTVNKNNLNSINAYEKMGFIKLESVIQDIGEGFKMDDYKMEKIL